MSIRSWLGNKFIKLTDGTFWSAYFGGGTWTGKSVNLENALNISAHWGCVRLISETLGCLPLLLYKTLEDDTRDREKNHALYNILHTSPNKDQTALEYWEGVGFALANIGNSYSQIERSGKTITALLPMPIETTRVSRNSDGDLRYTFEDRGKSEDLPSEKVFHIKGFGSGGDMGLSPLSYARQTLGIVLATEETVGKTFANGMRPSGFLKFKTTLTDPQYKQVRENIIAPLSSPDNAGKPGILEADTDWQDANINPHDAEMLLNRHFNVEDVCRWHRVPPVLVGHASNGQTMFGSGVEQIILAWLVLGFNTYLVRIEQAITKRLLTPVERLTLVPEFNIEGLLRADSAGRAEFMAKVVQNGLRTRNEMRRKDNLKPLPGGDTLTAQSNLVPLTMLGQAQSQPMRRQTDVGEPVKQ